MNTTGLLAQLESAVTNQVMLAGNDPSVESAARVILAVLEPALHQAAFDLAQQAAAEVEAQLGDQRVEVVISEGEPSLRVVILDGEPSSIAEGYEARLTLRLPARIKELIEQAAGSTGDSVNGWVVKALSSKAKTSTRASGRRVTGTVQL
ncbi:MAG: DUF1778 domain-containing protein [Acidimicrobiia bacterium]|nr:DUF1778 domain-containing protein [Acidimicrobiia bacterium]